MMNGVLKHTLTRATRKPRVNALECWSAGRPAPPVVTPVLQYSITPTWSCASGAAIILRRAVRASDTGRLYCSMLYGTTGGDNFATARVHGHIVIKLMVAAHENSCRTSDRALAAGAAPGPRPPEAGSIGRRARAPLRNCRRPACAAGELKRPVVP